MIKRLFDLAGAFALLIAAAPFLLCLIVLVRIRLGSPVFFTQLRPGLHGRPFRLIKFRTMTDARDIAGELLPDSVRLTSFGRLLRSTSLDELPELYNILRGEMSFVGPRPLLMEYLPLYSPRQAMRHAVRPGLTGWAQINGRNALSWPERFELDVWYVEHQSLWLDMKILLTTFRKVIKRDGINQEGNATMERFRGHDHG